MFVYFTAEEYVKKMKAFTQVYQYIKGRWSFWNIDAYCSVDELV